MTSSIPGCRSRKTGRSPSSSARSSYPILTFPEVPAIVVSLIDRPHEPAWGAGEVALCPTVPAIANAIFDATGIRLRTVPYTPGRVLAALHGT